MLARQNFVFLLLAVCVMTQVVVSSAYSDNDYDWNWDDTAEPKPYGIILPSIVFSVALAAVAGTFLLGFFCKNNPEQTGEPEEQFNVVLCQEDDVKYEYNLIFRVGCPTANFDMRHGFIDIEVLEGKDLHMLGNPIRFDCSLLPDRICGEMHCLIGRITPIQPIAGIRASHSDKHGAIFLYEYILVDLPDENVMEVRRFNTYLTNKPTIYRGTRVPNKDIEDELGMYPMLPLMEWTSIELAILSWVLVMFVGSVTMLFEYYDLYPFNQSQDGSMLRSLMDVVYFTPLTLVLLAAIAIPYKYCLRRNAQRAQYAIIDQLKGEGCCKFWWWWASFVVLCLLSLVSLCLFSVFIIFGLRISMVKSLYWLCSCLIVWSCVFGIWASVNSSLCFKRIFEEDAVNRAVATNPDGKGGDNEAADAGGDGGGGGSKKNSKKSTKRTYKLTAKQTMFFNLSNSASTDGKTNKKKKKKKKKSRKRRKQGGADKSYNLSSNPSEAGPKLINPMKQQKQEQQQLKQQPKLQQQRTIVAPLLNKSKCNRAPTGQPNSKCIAASSNAFKSLNKSSTIKNSNIGTGKSCNKPSKGSKSSSSAKSAKSVKSGLKKTKADASKSKQKKQKTKTKTKTKQNVNSKVSSSKNSNNMKNKNNKSSSVGQKSKKINKSRL